MKKLWSANKAFSRNLGLISAAEQDVLRDSLVVLPGCGGIGSTVAETLARLGVGRFRLADNDEYDIANFNRQLGATLASVGRNKAVVTREKILSINPDADVFISPENITNHNVDAFVSGADVVLDGIDFFALGARRALFESAHRQGIPAITAAPLGFSASMLIFLPDKGMSFDEYFDFKQDDNFAEVVTKFLVGLAPSRLHQSYMDMSAINIAQQAGPSSILGTQQAAVLIGAEVLRMVLGRGRTLPAPWNQQFDGFRSKWAKRYLPLGNRNPIQKLKFGKTKEVFLKLGIWDSLLVAGS